MASIADSREDTGDWREPSDPGGTRRPRFTGYPFTLGVASGAPEPTSVVLWTRLAPESLGGGGVGSGAVVVRWEMADDERFERVVARGEVDAVSAHWYPFIAGDDVSPVGRTRTTPAIDARVDGLRFAIGSCQQYEQGYFAAHRHLADEDLDLMLFVGDYVYESSWGVGLVRRHVGGEPRTLAEYRTRHAQYKTDPDLQRLHAAVPWLVTWDDHEVDNDYADERSEDLDPEFLTRRAAGYRAYFEHMPLRAMARPRGPDMRLYARCEFGTLATIHVLDGRQYRSPQACPRAGRGGSNRVGPSCEELFREDRTMLGKTQERWLAAGLREAPESWNVIAEATLTAPAAVGEGDAQRFWTDAWDGYPAARDRLLEAIEDAAAQSCLLVSGDAHTNYVCDLHRGEPASATLATEFCGTSITSQGRPQEQTDEIRRDNPHIHLADSSQRGYVVFDVGTERCEARLRVVADVRDRATGVETLATFAVAAGRPGATRS